MDLMTVELLTRVGCQMCATARRDLTRICGVVGVEFTEVDVDRAAADGRPEIRAEFGDRLPVVLLEGDEHSYWEVDEPRLRADLTRQG
jgi:glutaredoxin